MIGLLMGKLVKEARNDVSASSIHAYIGSENILLMNL